MDEVLAKLEQARKLYDKGDFDAALPLLEEVAPALSTYADVMNMLGVIHHARGAVDQARDCLERALEINPRYTEAAINLAVVYNEQGQYHKARAIHEQMVADLTETTPEPFALGKITNMHAALADAYAQLHLYDRAKEQFRAALHINPEFVDIRTRFGQFLRDIGELTEAAIQLRTVLEKKPDYTRARLMLGTVYYAQGDLDRAREQWQHVVDREPDNKTAHMYMKMLDQVHAGDQRESDAHRPVPGRTSADPDSLQFEGMRFSLDVDDSEN